MLVPMNLSHLVSKHACVRTHMWTRYVDTLCVRACCALGTVFVLGCWCRTAVVFPIEERVCAGGDGGQPLMLGPESQTPVAALFMRLASSVVLQVALALALALAQARARALSLSLARARVLSPPNARSPHQPLSLPSNPSQTPLNEREMETEGMRGGAADATGVGW